MSSAVVCAMNISSAGLRDACSCDVVVVFIHRSMDGVEHAVQFNQIVLCARIRHGRQMVRGSRQRRPISTSSMSDTNRSMHAMKFRSRTGAHGQLQALQATEALSNGSVRGWIKLSALGVAKEVIDRLKDALARIIVGRVVALVERIIDISVGGIGLWVRLSLVVLRRLVVVLPGMDRVQWLFKVVATGGETCDN